MERNFNVVLFIALCIIVLLLIPDVSEFKNESSHGVTSSIIVSVILMPQGFFYFLFVWEKKKLKTIALAGFGGIKYRMKRIHCDKYSVSGGGCKQQRCRRRRKLQKVIIAGLLFFSSCTNPIKHLFYPPNIFSSGRSRS